MKRLLCLLLALTVAQAATGASIRFDGVLGNSGVDGETLVRLEGTDFQRKSRSRGLAYDRFGALWVFGGTNNLLKLSLDGRMLGSYPIRSNPNQQHTLVLAGETLILKIGENILHLPITAPSGAPPEATEWKAKCISLNSVDGKIAMINQDGLIGTLEIDQGAFEPVAELREGERGNQVALLWDGKIMVDGQFTIGANEKREALNPQIKSLHQIEGDHLYEFLWHMTVSRRDRERQPAPGVVYGGSSGYFIGTLPKDGELDHPAGIAHIGGNRYAVASSFGVVHLVTFNPERQTFETTRRLGAIHQSGPMVLDPEGLIGFYSGYWEWNDTPSHILRSSNGFSSREVSHMQAALLPPANQMVFGYQFMGKPTLMHRPLSGPEPHQRDMRSAVDDLPPNPTGVVVYTEDRTRFALVVDGAGKGTITRFGSNHRVSKSEGAAEIRLTNSKPAITSLGLLPDGRFVAADAGAVVLLERDGKTFKEISRWNTWGGNEKFGPEIHLCVDGEALWVSDTANHRVVHFTLSNGHPEAFRAYTSQGLTTPLNGPTQISASRNRASVIDWGNHRIVKLSLSE